MEYEEITPVLKNITHEGNVSVRVIDFLLSGD